MPGKAKEIVKTEEDAAQSTSSPTSSPWTGRTRGKKLPESVLNELTAPEEEMEEEEFVVNEDEIVEMPELAETGIYTPIKVCQGPKHPTLLYLSKVKPDYIYRFIFKCYQGEMKIYKCMECELMKRRHFPNANRELQERLVVPWLFYKEGYFDVDPDVVQHCCTMFEETDLIKYRKLNMLRDKVQFQSEPVDDDEDVDVSTDFNQTSATQDLTLFNATVDANCSLETLFNLAGNSSKSTAFPKKTTDVNVEEGKGQKTNDKSAESQSKPVSEGKEKTSESAKSQEGQKKSTGNQESTETLESAFAKKETYDNPRRLRYRSERFANVVYEFIRRSKGDKYGATYRCMSCNNQRMAMSQSEHLAVLPQVPIIRWRNGFFLSDPDELDHFCQSQLNSDDIDVEMLDSHDYEGLRPVKPHIMSIFFPAIIKSQPARKATIYMYESRKVEDAVYEFVYLHENKCHQVFQCVGCKDTKLYHMNLGEPGPFPSVPTINVIRKNFLSDPDELKHFCLIPGEYEKQVEKLKEKEKKDKAKALKRKMEAEASTSKEDEDGTPKSERWPAVEGISLHGKHPLYMYSSTKLPDTVWQFSFKSLNQNDVTYKCTRCDGIKRELLKADKDLKLVIPTIRIRAGHFLTDPDDLQHFCGNKTEPREGTFVKQVVLKIVKEQRVCPRTLNEARAAIRYELQQASIKEEDFRYDLAVDYFSEVRQKSLARRLRRNMQEHEAPMLGTYQDEPHFSMHSKVGDYLIENANRPNAHIIRPQPYRQDRLAPYVHKNPGYNKHGRYYDIDDNMVLERYINEDGQQVVVVRGDDERLLDEEIDVVEEEFEVPYDEQYVEQYIDVKPDLTETTQKPSGAPSPKRQKVDN
ncbi:unnamed protein product [Bursaphelenchus okinawaensis]|uniref:Uncharacterized protein n=1 Tax=Bursaphelenchus okinawaensis TaxID=465554 RepID=A0A811JVE0_9BILA|nr:unnamed protein product [Bursaphelenchus okinawaensis]CAG9084747.1 unnamed protein product [Bursaphelenchus okinawaensis]